MPIRKGFIACSDKFLLREWTRSDAREISRDGHQSRAQRSRVHAWQRAYAPRLRRCADAVRVSPRVRELELRRPRVKEPERLMPSVARSPTTRPASPPLFLRLRKRN